MGNANSGIQKIKGVMIMQKSLKQEVAQYLYPFIGNTNYGNRNYYKKLIKKHGKKIVVEKIKELRATGNFSDALN
jgi:hypothetical protein